MAPIGPVLLPSEVMTELERKAAHAWDHIRQAGSTIVKRGDWDLPGYRELKKRGLVTIDGNHVLLAGALRRAFLAGDDLPSWSELAAKSTPSRGHATRKHPVAIGNVYDVTTASGDSQFTIIGYFDEHGDRKWRVRWSDGHLSALPESAFPKYGATFSHKDFVAEPKIGHATKKKTAAQLDAEIADILAGPTAGPGSFQPGDRVKCTYRGDHVGKVLAVDDPRAWAGTIAFPQDKPSPRAIKEHVLKHPRIAVKSIPILYKFGVQWDNRDCLSLV